MNKQKLLFSSLTSYRTSHNLALVMKMREKMHSSCTVCWFFVKACSTRSKYIRKRLTKRCYFKLLLCIFNAKWLMTFVQTNACKCCSGKKSVKTHAKYGFPHCCWSYGALTGVIYCQTFIIVVRHVKLIIRCLWAILI